MRRAARWFLGSVLVLDACFVVLLLAGGLPTIGAEAAGSTTGSEPLNTGAPSSGETTPWTREGLELLGRTLEERSLALARRENELEELLRGAEVLRLTGEEPVADAESGEDADSAPTPSAADRGVGNAATSEAFARLRRTYENMEPTTASQALTRLATRDKAVVVQLILGLQPRTAGAILDALTAQDPALAADLSYEIWKLGGNETPAAAENGR